MEIIFFFIIIIFSAIIHEYSHAWTADSLGDPTAKYAGRMTLNPLAHLDPFGTILMPLFLYLISGGAFLFAYAKPVPYNPYNLRNQRWGPALLAIAGPLSNLMTGLIFGLMVRLLPQNSFTSILGIIVWANLLLAIFNLVPIPPLDGSKILFALLPGQEKLKLFLEINGPILLLFFIFFAFRLIIPIILILFKLITGLSLIF